MTNKLHSHITLIIGEVLNVDTGSTVIRLRSQIPSWDSLKHMELILRLEEEFHIRFTSREVAEIESIDDLIRMIDGKL